MDWLSFWSRVVDSLAWPVAAVGLALLLRHPLAQLLPLIRSVRYREFEAKFEKGIAQLQHSEAAALPAGIAPPAASPPLSEAMADLAETSPRAAVIESWQALSRTCVAALKGAGVSIPAGDWPAPFVEDQLEKRGILNRQQLVLLRRLRGLRNAAVHGPDFRMSSGEALQFALTASKLAAILAAKAGA